MSPPRTNSLSRREFLADAGGLVVGFTLAPALARAQSLGADGVAIVSPPSADQLDSWLVIARDERITVYAGKVELGTGVSTALRQIVAEELDVPVERITWVQGDSQLTVDQGRTVGSGSVKRGGAQLRRAAAEARQALLEMAAAKLAVPANQLVVADGGVISVDRDASKRITFGALIGGGRFERTVSGRAAVKSPAAYKTVGQPVRRAEIPAKMTGTHVYVHDVRVPNMLHGRVVRPPRVGARLVSLDDQSVAKMPGVVRVVRKGTFVGVVAEREEQAARAAKALSAQWDASPVLPDSADLYARFKTLATNARQVGESGDADATLRSAANIVRATYRWPFQLHASIGASCAVADVRDAKVTVWSATQGAHQLCAPIAALLGVPETQVRVIFTEGSGCYGHNGADDVAGDAALLSQAVGRPVRVQWSRADEHGWEPEGPAMVFEMAGAVADGKISAWTYDAWTPTHGSRPTRDPATIVAGMLVAGQAASGEFFSGGGERNARTTYVLPNERVTSHPVPSFPIRTSSLRGLGSPQNSFANESFVDELAAAAGADPAEFRRRHLTDPRALAVIDAALKRAGWVARTTRPARASATSSAIAKGRGFAYVQYDRTEAYVAAVVDVEVRPDTGTVRVRRACVAHDCGLIVNPDGLRNQIEGNVIQAISRTLKEAVKFDSTRVTSVDWNSYPILRFSEIPDAIDIELIDRTDQPPVGAGEAATSPIPAAIANAIFDAIGVRPRDVPFTPERVRAALRA